jgi:hypothetical protein
MTGKNVGAPVPFLDRQLWKWGLIVCIMPGILGLLILKAGGKPGKKGGP